MRVLLSNIKIFFVVLCISSTFCMDVGEQRVAYGALWSDSLNFCIDNIVTGKNGNVKLIFQADPSSKCILSQYDVDELHLNLKKEHNDVKRVLKIGDDSNAVVAGCAILVKYEVSGTEGFACVYTPLKQGKKTLGFISGFFGDEGSKLQSDNYQCITCSVEELSEKAVDRVNVIDLLNNAESRRDALLKFKDPIKQLHNHWMKAYEEKTLDDFLEKQRELIKGRGISAISYIKSSIKKFQENTKSNIGSLVDSEQLLLAYLRSKKGEDYLLKCYTGSLETIKGYLCEGKNLLEKEMTQAKNDLIKEINITPKEVEKLKDYECKIDKLTKNYSEKIRQLLGTSDNIKITPLYASFHLHTTRELCKYCAASLSADLTLLKIKEGLPTFFFASSSEMIQSGDTIHRPSGIGDREKIRKDEQNDDGLLNFNEIKQQNEIVFQKIFI